MPVFQPSFAASHHPAATAAAHQLHALQLQQQQVTIPSQYATNLTAHQSTAFPAHLQPFTMQYAQYPGAATPFSIPCKCLLP